MEYVNDIINRVKGLSALDKYKVITQLSETFDTERLSLDELLLAFQGYPCYQMT